MNDMVYSRNSIAASWGLAILLAYPIPVSAQEAKQAADSSAVTELDVDVLKANFTTPSPEMRKLHELAGDWQLSLDPEWEQEQSFFRQLGEESRIKLKPTRSGRFLVGDAEIGGGQVWFSFHLVFGYNPLDRSYRCTVFTPVSNIPAEGTCPGPDQSNTFIFKLLHPGISGFTDSQVYLRIQRREPEVIRLELGAQDDAGSHRRLLVVTGSKAKQDE